MGFLFGRQPSKLPDFTGLQIQTAVNTMPIPIIFGTPRVSANLIYMNDFTAVPSSGSSSGKGGGKGLLSGGKNQTGQYNYSATLILALGEGTLGPIQVVFQDQGIYNLGGLPNPITGGNATLTYFNGAPGQAPWNFIEENHPGDARNYAYTAYLAGAPYPLDSTATVPQFNFLIQGLFQGTCPLYRANYTIANQNAPASPAEQTVVLNLDMDADPATCIFNLLTSPQYGVLGFTSNLPGLPVVNGITTFIDPTIFSTANATNLSVGDSSFQTYCQAAGFGFSVVLNSTEQASGILDRWTKLLATAVVWTGTTLKFIPYWDMPTQANPGYDSGNEAGILPKYFVPLTTPLFSLTDDDFVQTRDGNDPITYERTDTADIYNTVRLDFKDRMNLWNDNVVEAKDENDIENNGIRVDSLGFANEFSLQAFAANAAQVIVQRNTSIRNRFTFKLSWEFCILDPMDVVEISDANLDLVNFPVRITSISEDEHFELTITAEEFPIGAQSAILYPKQASSTSVLNTNFPSNSINPPFVYEPTTAQLQAQGQPTTPVIVIGLSASVPGTGEADPNFGGAVVWGSTDNITYAPIGRFAGKSTMGVLSAGFATYSGANPDNTNTLAVDLTESGGELESFTATQASMGLSICALYGTNGSLELLSYTTATITAPFKYNLTGLYRGLYGTTPVAASIGGQFIYLGNGNYFESALPPQFVGVSIYLKFPAFNSFNSTTQDLADVEVYEYVPVGNAIIPINPSSCVDNQLSSPPADFGNPALTLTCQGDFGITTAVLGPLSFDFGTA